jgi:hypothetical protein
VAAPRHRYHGGGQVWHRIRVLGRPLSESECAQLTGYREAAEAGEVIRIADRSLHPELAVFARDFWLLDAGTANSFAALLSHDHAGAYLGAEMTAEPAVVMGLRDRPGPGPAVLGVPRRLPGPAEDRDPVTVCDED